MKLALDSERPGDAMRNAYSYEYFIMNDPPVDDTDPSKPATSVMSGRCHSIQVIPIAK